MSLAIKRIHNLPPHLSYVSTLPDITQKLKHGTELKQRLIDTWDRIFRALSMKPVANMAACMCMSMHACVKAKGRHFKHLLL